MLAEVDEGKVDRVTRVDLLTPTGLLLIFFGCCNFRIFWLELPLVFAFSALKLYSK